MCVLTLLATGEGQNIIGRKTFSELRQGVARMAAAMKAIGIHKGDRVAGRFLFSCLSSS